METTETSEDARIHAELDAIAAQYGGGAQGEQPPDEGTLATQAEAPPMDWRMAAAGLVLVCDMLAPNWELEPAEKDALASGFEGVLSAFFPSTNLDPRVQACLALGGVMLAIAAKRTDLSTGKVKPMRKPREKAPEQGAAQGRAPT